MTGFYTEPPIDNVLPFVPFRQEEAQRVVEEKKAQLLSASSQV